MGHAGAWAAPGEPSADDKTKALERAGVVMVNHPERFGEGMKTLLSNRSGSIGNLVSLSVLRVDMVLILQFSGLSTQKRGLHTMRRASPITRPRAPGSMKTRSLYIKQTQALDMLKEKSMPVRKAAPSGSDITMTITVDRTALSPCIIVSSPADSGSAWKLPFDYTTTNLRRIAEPAIAVIASHLTLPETEHAKMAGLIQTLWQIFKEKEAFSLETKIGSSSDGGLEVRGARFGFDDASYKSSGRQEGIQQLRDKASENPPEVEAEKDGIVYVE